MIKGDSRILDGNVLDSEFFSQQVGCQRLSDPIRLWWAGERLGSILARLGFMALDGRRPGLLPPFLC